MAAPFYIFKSPTVIMPTLQIWRKISNPFQRLRYNWGEHSYSYEKFMDGAVQAALLVALSLREDRMDKIREISTEKLTGYLNRRMPELPKEQLADRLNFSRQQIVRGIIHSSFFTYKTPLQRLRADKVSTYFYSTFVFYIDRTGKKLTRPLSTVLEEEEQRTVDFSKSPRISKLLRHPEDLLVCNMTLARKIEDNIPVGRWRISDLNFFDCEFATDKIHNY